jgi:peptidoglycan/LPS O-acetylase OafA/YrhL
MSQPKDHILVINSLRGIAASAVCFYHFVCTTIGYINDELILDIFHFGQKGVQLFFIVSGIVIPLAMINSNYNFSKWKSFILKRFIRIEPPYLVAVAIAIIYLFARNYIPSSATADLTPTVTEVILHLGYLIPFFEDTNWVNPVFWTLAVEFQYYLLLSLAFPLLLKDGLIFRLSFYTLLIGLQFIPVTSGFFTFWSSYFLIGILYALYFKTLITKTELFIMYAILAPLTYFHLGGVDLGIAAVAILIIHFLQNFKTRVTLFLGKISYSLYLLHSIIGAAFINFMSHKFTATHEKVIVILCGFLLSVLSAYLMYRLIEKPTHNYARKIK